MSILRVSFFCFLVASIADPERRQRFLERAQTHINFTTTWDSKAAEQFGEFKHNFSRNYTNGFEELRRFEIFRNTLRKVEMLNTRSGQSAVFGVTSAADFDTEELGMFFSMGSPTTEADLLAEEMTVAPDSHGQRRLKELALVLNWAHTKAVTPVKAQGACLGCWAVTAAEEIESMYALNVDDGSQQIFSSQQILSCTPMPYASGCAGGSFGRSLLFLQKSRITVPQEFFWPWAQGLTPEAQCLHKNCTQSCSPPGRYSMDLVGPYAKVTDVYLAVPECKWNSSCEDQDLEGLKRHLNEVGPLAVRVNARNWHHYVSGVMTYDACGGITQADTHHAVQLVGYNAVAPLPYWIVRNSWSTNWGIHGYIHLEMGRNTCGIANQALYPRVVGPRGNAESNAFRQLYVDASRTGP